MALNSYEDLYRFLVGDLPKAPTNVLLHELQQVGHDFCLETEAWRIWLDSFNIVDEQREYTLRIPFEAQVCRVLEVRLNTAEGVTAGNDGALQDEDDYDFNPSTNLLKLAEAIEPTESVTAGFDVKVALAPMLHARDLDEDFLQFFARALCDGVKAKMMRQEGKPWSNPKRAEREFEPRYQRAIALAKRDNTKGYKAGNVKMVIPDF